MNIAIITWEFPAISESFIVNHITGLLDLGHNVKIFAFTKRDDSKIHEQVKKYNLFDRIRYVIFPVSKKERIGKGLRIILKYLFLKPVIIIGCLNFFKYKRDALNLTILFRVAPFLDERFDLVHCHFATTSNEFLILKDILKTKYITTIHGDDRMELSCRKEETALKNLFKKADLLLPISEFWKSKMINMGCAPEKIKVHHMGIKFDGILEKKAKRPDVIKLLTIGRLVEKKGIEYSIKAVAKTLKKHSNIQYRIIGDGSLKNKLQLLIEELKIGRNVELIGIKNNAEIQIELTETDIFILVSVTDSFGNLEGIPVSLMEAQGMGLPVISTFHSGIPELVINNKSGFLIPEKDVDALSEKLDYLIEHPDTREKMGAFGHNYVYEYFNSDKLILELNEIYKDLLK